MTDWPATIGAIAGALVPVGGGIAFVWNKIEARFQEIEGKLQDCHDREVEHQERRTVQLTVIELLWQEVSRSNPDAWVIKRAKQLLDGLKDRVK